MSVLVIVEMFNALNALSGGQPAAACCRPCVAPPVANGGGCLMQGLLCPPIIALILARLHPPRPPPPPTTTICQPVCRKLQPAGAAALEQPLAAGRDRRLRCGVLRGAQLVADPPNALPPVQPSSCPLHGQGSKRGGGKVRARVLLSSRNMQGWGSCQVLRNWATGSVA
jgi:hypothetical protein